MNGLPSDTGYTAHGVPVVSVAPMMDYTDRHFRYFFRQISRRTLLYSEMITSSAIIHGDRDLLLAFDPIEHPISLQLGGDNPEEIARAIEIAEGYGYDEYNLNVGCPSNRVQNGNFGACLMADPPRVAEIARAMQGATTKPVTIKHRIGIDGRESYGEMLDFVDTVAGSGVTRFTVHARIAILAGLDPKRNRSVPPLRYEDVYRLKRERPRLEIEMNGHVKTLSEVESHLLHVDAVMLGRAAYENPWLFSTVDHRFFGDEIPSSSREEVVRSLYPYFERLERVNLPPRRLINHILGLFASRPGARAWKQALSGRLPDFSGPDLLERALSRVPEQTRRERPSSRPSS